MSGMTPVGPTGSGQYVPTIDLILLEDIRDLTAELQAYIKKRKRSQARKAKRRARKKRRGW
jgi:hypothetical protein